MFYNRVFNCEAMCKSYSCTADKRVDCKTVGICPIHSDVYDSADLRAAGKLIGDQVEWAKRSISRSRREFEAKIQAQEKEMRALKKRMRAIELSAVEKVEIKSTKN